MKKTDKSWQPLRKNYRRLMNSLDKQFGREAESVDLIQAIEREQMRTDIPDFRPGDTVRCMSRS